MSAIFSHILGQEAPVKYLQRILQQESLAHAYCFSGPAHIGKTTVAESLAAAVLKTSPAEVQSQPNISVVERLVDEKTGQRKATISVEQIRDLRQRLGLTSLGGGTKVALIKQSDTMTTAAQNALLKTLEEPSGDTLIILMTDDETKLLETILSRTVHLRFTRVPREVICAALREQGAGREEAHSIAGLANGRPGIAFDVYAGDTLERRQAREEALKFWQANVPERIKLIGGWSKSKNFRAEALNKIVDLRILWHDILLAKIGAPDLVASSDLFEPLQELSEQQKNETMLKTLQALEAAETSIKNNGNVALALEHFALIN